MSNYNSTKLNIKFKIDNQLSDYCLCYYRDLAYRDPQNRPHYYINIPIKSDSYLLLCIITSQIIKRKAYYANNGKLANKTLKALVEINHNEITKLNKPSIIDCNQAELLTKETLINKIDTSYNEPFVIYKNNITDDLKSKIIQAVKTSPIVEQYIKDLLIDYSETQ